MSMSASKREAAGPGKTTVSTAKRSPSILVTDVRKNQIRAPFAGHKLEQQKHKMERSQDRVTNLVKSMRRSSNSKYSNISVSNLTSNISDIPSSRQRESPRFMSHDLGARTNAQKVPQYVKNLPSRTSKVTQKLVLIPENELNASGNQREKSTTDNIFQEINSRTKAEKMTKEQREQEYPRVTAYLIAEGFNLKLTSKFLAKYHMVLPRLYDEVLYIPYSLPLLPGENGYRVQSNTSLKMQRGIQLMEHFINKSEERDHHYEFYSGADNENNETSNNGLLTSHSPNPNDFDPSEPQFFVSNSPTESIIEQEIRDSINENRSDSNSSNASDVSSDSINTVKAGESDIPRTDGELNVLNKHVDSTEASLPEENTTTTNGKPVDTDEKLDSMTDSKKTEKEPYTAQPKRRYSFKQKSSHLPDLTKHAEMFILDYGVVVFWNFSEIHEKNILADLVFAKIQPGEFDDDEDDEDDEDEEDEDDIEDEDAGGENRSGSDYDDAENDENEMALIIKPVSEHDIETEEFHFEYNRDVPTPRIYNDMITLKSGDHLIKLTMSHAIAQSTKLSLFESKMSNVLNSISKLPKALALTGRLHNYTTQRLLTKTGRLFQLRSEVNLLSNVLDTPEYFWSIEPGLHPLYTAVRDYLEIEQRVEVINDRCKVFLDFFDILADSLAERKMTKITKMLIVAIGLSVIVSILEIFVRYLIISKFANRTL